MSNVFEFGKVENLILSGTKISDWKCSHSKLEREKEMLEKFRENAFIAHPNIDIDIENLAATKPKS